MSNIYIQEPQTFGKGLVFLTDKRKKLFHPYQGYPPGGLWLVDKVLLSTTVGDIDIELFSKEAPKACRNFVQLCMEGYYDGTIFHRIVPNFIAQGGDPTGTGEGGESIYGQPFKDEFHTRLRFVRRGLVAMANAGPNDNGSQFFFTLGPTPELMNKHTIFAKVSGNTVYNILKLQDCEIDANERPLFPNKITKTEVLSNPFDDIVPRVIKQKKEEEVEKKPKSKSKATKNFKLLSFGEEAEEDEEMNIKASEGWKGKSKSSHDLANDPKLSAVPAFEKDEESGQSEKRELETQDSEDDEEKEAIRENVKKKLKKDPDEKPKKAVVKTEPEDIKVSTRKDELKEEVKQLKKEIRESKKRTEKAKVKVEDTESTEQKDTPPTSDPLADFKMERLKYKSLRKQQGTKGSNREEITLAILDKFKTKLQSARALAGDYDDEEEEKTAEEDKEAEEEEEEDVNDLSWMNHKLRFEDNTKKVLDANITDVDRYEIFDPRNPITKRRREASKQSMKNRR